MSPRKSIDVFTSFIKRCDDYISKKETAAFNRSDKYLYTRLTNPKKCIMNKLYYCLLLKMVTNN